MIRQIWLRGLLCLLREKFKRLSLSQRLRLWERHRRSEIWLREAIAALKKPPCCDNGLRDEAKAAPVGVTEGLGAFDSVIVLDEV